MSGDVRVRAHRRRQYAARRVDRVPEPTFSPKVLDVAVDEAQEILETGQSSVVGYETEAQAQQVRRGLRARGIRTEVFASIGPPATATSALEDRELKKLGIEVGTRHATWGVRLTNW